MNGVEILSESYQYESFINPIWIVIIGVIGLIIAIIGACTINYTKLQHVLFILAGLVIIGIIVCFTGALIETDEIIGIEYKVTIDDSVSMNEFLDKYEIIDQEGKIYIVKERE